MLAWLMNLDFAASSGTTAPPPVISPPEELAGGGYFLYHYEREMARRRREKRRRDEAEEEARRLQDQVDREIALLLRRQEEEDARQAELERLRSLVRKYSRQQLDMELSERAIVAYTRVLAQENFSALEALERELARHLEEEEQAVLMLLLN
jgi:hypothetical protein